jgi:hypothetical protein
MAIHRYGSRKKRLLKDGTPNQRTAELLAEWRAKGLPFLEEEEADRTEAGSRMCNRSRLMSVSARGEDARMRHRSQ